MSAMAEAGQANLVHLTAPQQLEVVVTAELEGLQLVIGRQLQLRLQPGPGVELTQIHNPIDANAEGWIDLGGLQAGTPSLVPTTTPAVWRLCWSWRVVGRQIRHAVQCGWWRSTRRSGDGGQRCPGAEPPSGPAAPEADGEPGDAGLLLPGLARAMGRQVSTKVLPVPNGGRPSPMGAAAATAPSGMRAPTPRW